MSYLTYEDPDKYLKEGDLAKFTIEGTMVRKEDKSWWVDQGDGHERSLEDILGFLWITQVDRVPPESKPGELTATTWVHRHGSNPIAVVDLTGLSPVKVGQRRTIDGKPYIITDIEMSLGLNGPNLSNVGLLVKPLQSEPEPLTPPSKGEDTGESGESISGPSMRGGHTLDPEKYARHLAETEEATKGLDSAPCPTCGRYWMHTGPYHDETTPLPGKCAACGHEWDSHGKSIVLNDATTVYQCNVYAGMGDWCGCEKTDELRPTPVERFEEHVSEGVKLMNEGLAQMKARVARHEAKTCWTFDCDVCREELEKGLPIPVSNVVAGEPRYCEAVLRPEGIACTLMHGHDRYVSKQGWTCDHVNVGSDERGSFKRSGAPTEWGFNNPIGRRLGAQG
jgi:hypothetical protein